MHLTPATPAHALSIHNLHTKAVRTTCKDFYTPEQIEAWLKGRTPEGYAGIAKGEMYVAEEDGKILGFGHSIPGEIVAIYVDPDSHNKGVGKSLLEHGMTIASKGHTKIKVESTLNAEGFYKKHGFVRVKAKAAVIVRNNIEIPGIVMECTTV